MTDSYTQNRVSKYAKYALLCAILSPIGFFFGFRFLLSDASPLIILFFYALFPFLTFVFLIMSLVNFKENKNNKETNYSNNGNFSISKKDRVNMDTAPLNKFEYNDKKMDKNTSFLITLIILILLGLLLFFLSAHFLPSWT